MILEWDRRGEAVSTLKILLETLITSKTRIKLLLKLFLNPQSRGYLQGLASEFGESSNAIRLELNRFSNAGLISSDQEGRKKVYKANAAHPLYDDIQNILKKFVGIDAVVENIASRIGNLTQVYVEGELAQGINAQVVDLILVGEHIDRMYLTKLIAKAEPLIHKKVRYVCIEPAEKEKYLSDQGHSALLIWNV